MKKEKIHFIGICGSGACGTAILAHHNGYDVSGCDDLSHENYIDFLRQEGIKVDTEHSTDHIKDSDTIIAAESLYYVQSPPPELKEAKDSGKLITWQEFLGKNILPSYKSVVVCGSHGKTTTSALLAKTLIDVNLDPSLVIGAVVPDIGRNYRVGRGNLCICEGDEKNFSWFHPNIAIVNNIDFEHPEKFNSVEDYYMAFKNFLCGIRKNGQIIANFDHRGVLEVISQIKDQLKNKNIRITGYSLKGQPDAQFKAMASGNFMRIGKRFFKLKLFGEHNMQNALGVYVLAKQLGISDDKAEQSFQQFEGTKRRLEKIFEKEGIALYDDYAHHPTEVKASLKAIKEKYPAREIIALFEPHQISRIERFSSEFQNALSLADHAIFLDIYAGRESGKKIPCLSFLIDFSNGKFHYPKSDNERAELLEQLLKGKEAKIIIVMGAGNSSKVAQELKNMMSPEAMSQNCRWLEISRRYRGKE